MSADLTEVLEQYRALAAEYEAEPDDGLSNAEWGRINDADELVRSATEAAAARRLKRRVPDAQKRVKRAQSGLDAAKGPARTVESTVSRVERDLSESQRMLAECAGIDNDDTDDGTGLSDRLDIRVRRAALAEEAHELTLKLGRVRTAAAPFLAARGAAEAELKNARTALTELENSISDPFSTATGRRTDEFRKYLLYTGNFGEHPSDPATRSVLVSTLKSCGLWESVVHEIVDLWLAGDTGIRQASGILRDDDELRVERNRDGQVIAIDQRGSARVRLSGENRAPEPAMSGIEARQAWFGDLLAGPQ